MIKESKYYSKVTETQFNKPLVVTKKDNDDDNNEILDLEKSIWRTWSESKRS